ncbi:MAG: hypothetical protein ABFD92_08805 [Planctomycetaceae bacterium]|nr:hypothetical protein [Planctomycetaceae bacterium]
MTGTSIPPQLPSTSDRPPPTLPIAAAVTPLRLIFWGGLLVILDFKLFWATGADRTSSCDILNDTLGAILILVGLCRLLAIPAGGSYRRGMWFVLVACVLEIAKTVCNVFIRSSAPLADIALGLISLVTLIAMLIFCMYMRDLCRKAWLPSAQTAWTITLVLFALLYAPVALFHLAMLARAMGIMRSFNPAANIPMLLLLPVFVAPLVSLFVSTSLMKRHAMAFYPNAPDAVSARNGIAIAGTVVGLALGVGLAIATDKVASAGPQNNQISTVSSSSSWGNEEQVSVSVSRNSRGQVGAIVVQRLETAGESPRSNIELGTRSGLVIDGVERPLDKPLTLIYVSNRLPATDVPVQEDEIRRLCKDVQEMPPIQFYRRWVRTRVRE